MPESKTTENPSAAPGRGSPINAVFAFFLIGAVLFAVFTGRTKEVTESSFESAKSAVTLALSLVGVMAFWLGMVRVLEAGGMLKQVARLLGPAMKRLFPEVPVEHPAMSAMLLNLSANMLGLGNAATPLGIKAMVELNKLNPFPGTATNAMCLFLAINTSSVTLLPLGVIGVRAAAGASDPAAIILPTLLATLTSTTVAIMAALFFARRSRNDSATVALAAVGDEAGPALLEDSADADVLKLRCPTTLLSRAVAWFSLVVFVVALVMEIGRQFAVGDVSDFLLGDFLSYWFMLLLMLLIVAYGLGRGVRVYEAVTDGAKQGFDVAVRIIPFLVAILVGIGMFRASGAMEFCALVLQPLTGLIHMPVEVLPVALVRPLSASGAFGLMSAIIQAAPDSYEAYVASAVMGSTETTFYVLAVYFGAVGVTRIRYTLAAALMADAAGLISASLYCHWLWPGA